MEVIDYVIILVAIISSAGAGLYFGFFKKKDDSVREYFLASQNLSVFNISCSVFATVLSSGQLVGIVAEIYYYGFQPIWQMAMAMLARYISIKLIFSVIYNLKSHDVLKYYELKFHKNLRYFLSTLAIIELIFTGSIVIYATSTSFSQATGINVWVIAVLLTTTCAIYSAMGGVRGVTLADMIQGMVIFVSTLVVFIIGIVYVGGVSTVWERNAQGQRTELFNFDLNPKVRHTFWTSTILFTINLTAMLSTAQAGLLRLMASQSLQKAIRAAYISCVFIVVVHSLIMLLGLVVYAAYHGCDPMASGTIRSHNQLTASFIGDALSGYCGVSGLFYSALLCAAISTLSSELNAVSALIMETLVRPLKVIKSDVAYTSIAKISVFIVSGLSLAGTVIIRLFPNVFQATMVISATTNGPQFALLIIGVFFPQVSNKSSIGSFIIGIVFMLWVLVGSLLVTSPNITKPVSIALCCDFLSPNSTAAPIIKSLSSKGSFCFQNSTLGSQKQLIKTVLNTTELKSTNWETYFPLSTFSYNYFTLIGIIATLFAFVILAFIFGANKEKRVDPNLIPDWMQTVHKKLSRKWKKLLFCDIYDEKVNEELNEIQAKKLLPIELKQ